MPEAVRSLRHDPERELAWPINLICRSDSPPRPHLVHPSFQTLVLDQGAHSAGVTLSQVIGEAEAGQL